MLIIVFAKVRDLIIYSAASRHLADELLGQRGGFFLEKKETPAEAAATAAAASDLPFCCLALCVLCIFSARASRRRGCRFSPIIIAQPLLKKCVPESGAHTHTRVLRYKFRAGLTGKKSTTRCIMCVLANQFALSYLAAGCFLLVNFSSPSIIIQRERTPG